MATDISVAPRFMSGAEPLELTEGIDPTCMTCVVIPARDEAATILDTLTSLSRQRTIRGANLDAHLYEVILLANNCRDDTAGVARAFAAHHPNFKLHVVERTMPAALSHVGAARRLLMDAALERLTSIDRARGVIASTDADSRVAPDWIAQTLREIDAGVDAVGGRIMLERAGASSRTHERATTPGTSATRRLHLLDNAYHLLATTLVGILDPVSHDPLPRHHQHFGGSFAITAAAYFAVGGLPVVPYLEDVALYRAIINRDLRFRHSPRVRVTTSDREDGRTRLGLSRQLREWTELRREGRTWFVESGGEIERRARLVRDLREVWIELRAEKRPSSSDLFDLAAGFAIDAERLAAYLESCDTFGALIEKVGRAQRWSGAWRARWSLVAIETAVADLRRRIVHRKTIATTHADAATNNLQASSPATLCRSASALDTLEEVEPVPLLAAAV